ncbi:hypothetical protein HGG78_04320 [Vibrio aestuarianus]|uniref:hypothetical protein n=1 Tax=Vibrio aestuarianus TaxID=28171 RepID=UPI00155932B9|nr:hypothetical protein [Vibrio aestuarianus]NGZ12988.1 hypothetical protein [Vibrio aestuarianus]NKZ49136.1 hypothetical protein [Vibrio aestuarianus]
MGLTTTKKKLLICVLLLAPLSLPWINALFSDFVLTSQFSDREIKMVGSHGRFKLQTEYEDRTQSVVTGYYGSLFDTLYMLSVRQNKVVEGNPNNLNVFLKSHQVLVVFKIKHSEGRNYTLKRVEEDPRLGMRENKMEATGYFGPLSSI